MINLKNFGKKAGLRLTVKVSGEIAIKEFCKNLELDEACFRKVNGFYPEKKTLFEGEKVYTREPRSLKIICDCKN